MILRRPKNAEPRRGVTAVEAAFVLGTLLLFMIGILEYARYLFFMHMATNATATAARYAVAHTGDGTTSTQVQAIATDAMNSQQSMVSGYTVTVFAAQSGSSPPVALGGTAWNDAVFGGGICVRITGTYTFLSSGLLGLNGVPVNVSAVMTSEAN